MVTRREAAVSVFNDLKFLLSDAGPNTENGLYEWIAAHDDIELSKLLDGMAALITLVGPLYKTIEVKWLERAAKRGEAFTALIEKVAAEGVDVSGIHELQANALKRNSPFTNVQRSERGDSTS